MLQLPGETIPPFRIITSILDKRGETKMRVNYCIILISPLLVVCKLLSALPSVSFRYIFSLHPSPFRLPYNTSPFLDFTKVLRDLAFKTFSNLLNS